MQKSKPTSFKLFIVELVIVAILFLLISIKPGPGYVVIFAFIILLTFVLTGVGIYSGLKYKADDDKLRRRNRIGLLGNALILLVIISVVVYALSFIK